jgi:hypothetical protein
MKSITLLLAIFLCLALACPALAQPAGGMGAHGGMGGRLYDPKTVTTIKGTVEKLEDLPSMGPGLQYRGITLKTAEGNILLYMGPARYLEEKKFAAKVGDTMEATGSKLTLNNQPSILPREVTVNGVTLKLRDDQGIPLWRRMGLGHGGGMGPGAGRGKAPAAK